MQNLAPGIWVLAHSSVSPWRPQHREKGALLRTSSAWSTCDLGRGGRRGERASDQIRDSGRGSVLWVIVPDLNLSLVCAPPPGGGVWGCGVREAGSKNAHSSRRAGSNCPSCVGWAPWAFWSTFLRGHGWRHLWHGEASADFGFKPQSLYPRAHGQGHRLGLCYRGHPNAAGIPQP